jgi:hypothetical protein
MLVGILVAYRTCTGLSKPGDLKNPEGGRAMHIYLEPPLVIALVGLVVYLVK